MSKPHLDCIQAICQQFGDYREKILFRFTIGACDDTVLSFWEPGAPTYAERMASLQYAYEQGFQTSVSVEPMLDSANIDQLIAELSALRHRDDLDRQDEPPRKAGQECGCAAAVCNPANRGWAN